MSNQDQNSTPSSTDSIPDATPLHVLTPTGSSSGRDSFRKPKSAAYKRLSMILSPYLQSPESKSQQSVNSPTLSDNSENQQVPPTILKTLSFYDDQFAFFDENPEPSKSEISSPVTFGKTVQEDEVEAMTNEFHQQSNDIFDGVDVDEVDECFEDLSDIFKDYLSLYKNAQAPKEKISETQELCIDVYSRLYHAVYDCSNLELSEDDPIPYSLIVNLQRQDQRILEHFEKSSSVSTPTSERKSSLSNARRAHLLQKRDSNELLLRKNSSEKANENLIQYLRLMTLLDQNREPLQKDKTKLKETLLEFIQENL